MGLLDRFRRRPQPEHEPEVEAVSPTPDTAPGVTPDGADLDEPETDPPIPWGGLGLSSPFLEGGQVLALQEKLQGRGFDLDLNGIYDEETAWAVAGLKVRERMPDELDTRDRATPELLGRLGL